MQTKALSSRNWIDKMLPQILHNTGVLIYAIITGASALFGMVLGQAAPVDIIPENLWALALLIFFGFWAFRYALKKLEQREARESELIDTITSDKQKEIDTLRLILADKERRIDRLEDILEERMREKSKESENTKNS